MKSAHKEHKRRSLSKNQNVHPDNPAIADVTSKGSASNQQNVSIELESISDDESCQIQGGSITDRYGDYVTTRRVGHKKPHRGYRILRDQDGFTMLIKEMFKVVADSTPSPVIDTDRISEDSKSCVGSSPARNVEADNVKSDYADYNVTRRPSSNFKKTSPDQDTYPELMVNLLKRILKMYGDEASKPPESDKTSCTLHGGKLNERDTNVHHSVPNGKAGGINSQHIAEGVNNYSEYDTSKREVHTKPVPCRQCCEDGFIRNGSHIEAAISSMTEDLRKKTGVSLMVEVTTTQDKKDSKESISTCKIHSQEADQEQQEGCASALLERIRSSMLCFGSKETHCTQGKAYCASSYSGKAKGAGTAKDSVQNGKDVIYTDEYHQMQLHMAAAENDFQEVGKLLDKGVDISAKSRYQGRTALHFAAANNACNAVEVLHKRGADTHCEDNLGRTPLMLSAFRAYPECTELLLSLGANAAVKDRYDETITKDVAMAVLCWGKTAQIKSGYIELYDDDQRVTLIEPMPDDPKQMGQSSKHRPNYRRYIDELFRGLISKAWDTVHKVTFRVKLLINYVFIILWALIAVFVLKGNACYHFPTDIWKVFLWVATISCSVSLFAWELIRRYKNYRQFTAWKISKLSRLKIEQDYCRLIDIEHGTVCPTCNHATVCSKCGRPKQTSLESQWFESELKKIGKMTYLRYNCHLLWILFDCIVFGLLATTFIFHCVDIALVPSEVCQLQDTANDTIVAAGTITIQATIIGTSAVSTTHFIIFSFGFFGACMRIFKYAKSFSPLGSFWKNCVRSRGPMAKGLLLYSVYYIPYACMVWVSCIDEEDRAVTFSDTLMLLFRITLVDDYDRQKLTEENNVVCSAIVGTYRATTTVFVMSVLLALIIESFKRGHLDADITNVMDEADELYPPRKFLRTDTIKIKHRKEDIDDNANIEWTREEMAFFENANEEMLMPLKSRQVCEIDPLITKQGSRDFLS
ncbi:uncharacterized protein [Ptychodera flava]|uniref:uncharacterized protein n=1 Tax=Ptychodera flava TaxID=63121 RepID=UPI003969CBD8